MNTEIKNAVISADNKTQYDKAAKEILKNKDVLAHILVKTVDEFNGMNPKDVIQYIEGEPYVGTVPVDPGMTNTERTEQGKKIVGLNNDAWENYEGLTIFDIIFYVRMKDGLSKIIVNIEAQKDEPTEYDIINRAIFYASRMVSSQKEREFVKKDYDGIKHVYSIWICMNISENSMNHIHLVNDSLLGSYQWKGKLDLFNIFLIGVSNKLPEHDEDYKLHRLLGALFSDQLSAGERLDIIDKEYNLEEVVGKELSNMCNLSQGIEDRGIAKGESNIILNMYRNGITAEQIATTTSMDLEKVKAIIEKGEPVLA